MKHSCNMIKDILPLYIDAVCSEDSKEVVEEHLEGCEDCRNYRELLDVKVMPLVADDKESDQQAEESLKQVKKKIKKEHILLGSLFAFGVLFLWFMKELFIGDVFIRTSDYCNFEKFPGYSNLEIFPSEPERLGEVTNYQYICADTFMDPTCKIVLECEFEDEKFFQEECDRLGSITQEHQGKRNEIVYSEDYFAYPAYVAMYNWSSCYEYALVLEEECKIVYVFLQGDFFKVAKEYMPLERKVDEPDFSVYSFNGYFKPKY